MVLQLKIRYTIISDLLFNKVLWSKVHIISEIGEKKFKQGFEIKIYIYISDWLHSKAVRVPLYFRQEMKCH